MRRITVGLLHALWVTAFLLGVAQLNLSLAQNPTPTTPATPPSQWLVITQVTVKPEMMVEFQNFMKTLLTPR